MSKTILKKSLENSVLFSLSMKTTGMLLMMFIISMATRQESSDLFIIINEHQERSLLHISNVKLTLEFLSFAKISFWEQEAPPRSLPVQPGWSQGSSCRVISIACG